MLSVALLTYNREYYIKYSLQAILAQNHKNFELIIIDNGSTDNTHSIVYEYIKNRKNTVFVRLDKYSDPNNSYLTALMYASNPFVLITHDDDILYPNYLSKCLNVLSIYNDIGLISSNISLINENGKLISKKLYSDNLFNNDLIIKKKEYVDLYFKHGIWLPTPTHVINRKNYFDIFNNNRIYKSIFNNLEYNKKNKKNKRLIRGDIELVIALNEINDLYFINDVNLKHRQHNNQDSKNNIYKPFNENIFLCEEVLKKNNFYSFETLNKVSFYKDKFIIEFYLSAKSINFFKNYLKSKNDYNPIIVFFKYYFFKTHFDLKNVYDDGIYINFLTKKINKNIFKLNSLNVIVGSMLVSNVLSYYLDMNSINVDFVIDSSIDRKGCNVFKRNVINFDDFIELMFLLNKKNKKNEINIILSSERDPLIINDNLKKIIYNKLSILSKKFILNIYEWRDLLY